MPKKKRLFRRLRGELIANWLTNSDLGRIMNRGECYVSRCLNGKAQFTLAEQYAIMDAIKRPYCDLYLIFPPGGKDIKITR